MSQHLDDIEQALIAFKKWSEQFKHEISDAEGVEDYCSDIEYCLQARIDAILEENPELGEPDMSEHKLCAAQLGVGQ